MQTCRGGISALRTPVSLKAARMSSLYVSNHHSPAPGGPLREHRDRRMRMGTGSRRTNSALQASLGKEVCTSLASSSCTRTIDNGLPSEERLQSSREQQVQRRHAHWLLLGVVGVGLGPAPAQGSQDGISPPPPVGDCPDCIGDVNGTLNACQLSSSSCVSIQNNDEQHFVPPWQYEGSREDAAEYLISIVTGGQYMQGMSQEPYGISRLDAAKYILGSAANVLQGRPPPARPERRVGLEAGPPFRGRLVQRLEDETDSLYLRFELYSGPAGLVDAEFLFLPGDNIVGVRAASRDQPSGLLPASLKLSMSSGVILDSNTARQEMDRLRKALNWEEAPVLTTFDPRFNMRRALWFEKLYQPFLGAFRQERIETDDEELPLDSFYLGP